MDNGYIYTIFKVITLRGMTVFQSNFLVGGGFPLVKVSTDFWTNRQGDCNNYLFAENLHMGKLDGKASVLHFVCLFIYLFIYLFIIYLLIYLLFIYFKAAVYKVMHQFCGWVPLGGAISIKLCSNFSEIALVHFALLRGFAAGCDEQLAFFFNLLLSLFISIKTAAKYTFYV